MKIRSSSEALNEAELRKQQQTRKNELQPQQDKTSAKLQTEDTVKVGLSRAIAELTNPRSERIAELKALIDSGKYQVDTRKIADAVKTTVDEEIQLEKLLGL